MHTSPSHPDMGEKAARQLKAEDIRHAASERKVCPQEKECLTTNPFLFSLHFYNTPCIFLGPKLFVTFSACACTLRAIFSACACTFSVGVEVQNMEATLIEDERRDVCVCIGEREKELRDSMCSVGHERPRDETLTAADREHEECTSVVVYREAGRADESRDWRLLRLSWDADRSW